MNLQKIRQRRWTGRPQEKYMQRAYQHIKSWLFSSSNICKLWKQWYTVFSGLRWTKNKKCENMESERLGGMGALIREEWNQGWNDAYTHKLRRNKWISDRQEGRWGEKGWEAAQKHTCALLTDIGEVVVAGNVVPAPALMCNHHHTVLPTREEIVRLIFPPVLKLL